MPGWAYTCSSMDIVYIIAGIFVSAVVIALVLGHVHGTLAW